MSVDLEVDESISINGGLIVITLRKKTGRRARIVIEAEQEVIIQQPSELRHHTPADMVAKKGVMDYI
jgi:hypothetical protein